MKIKREDQAKQLAYSMCHWLRNNPEELQKRILHDLETMGDMQLAGVAKDLGISFEEDEPEEKWAYTCPNCGNHEFLVEMKVLAILQEDGEQNVQYMAADGCDFEPSGPDAFASCRSQSCQWEGTLRDIELT